MPPCDQVMVPVGEYPVTTALQVTVLGDAAGTSMGLHETVVFVALIVAVKLYVPADWKFLESPP